VAVQLLIDTDAASQVCTTVGLPRPGPTAVRADHTDFKNNRIGRGSRQRRHRRGDHQTQTAGAGTLPDTAGELALLPGHTQPRGIRSISDDTSLGASPLGGRPGPLRRPDHTEFDKCGVFLYAYRHSYAQRADAGTSRRAAS
jgi:hypothetical protein